MIRVLIGGDGSLREGEARHLEVRRVEPGESVELRDGEGLVGSGTLRRSGKRWSVERGVTDRVAPPPPLVLAVGAAVFGQLDRIAFNAVDVAELIAAGPKDRHMFANAGCIRHFLISRWLICRRTKFRHLKMSNSGATVGPI